MHRILIGLLVASWLAATDIPVFRYALENWEPAPHLVTVSGPAADRAAIGVEAYQVGPHLELDASAADGPAPSRLVVRLPEREPWFDGPWSPGLLRELSMSSVRTAIARMLTSGASVVWVLIESGDPAVDAAMRARLDARLAYLAKVVTLPTPPEDYAMRPGQIMRRQMFGHIPLRIDMRVLTVRRDDPSEAHLIAQCDRLDPEAGPPGPCAVPVFGRGRALARLPAALLTDEAIDGVTQFLLGACSCQVKDQNPGADLLMGVDWEALLTAPDDHPAVASMDVRPASDAIIEPLQEPTVFGRKEDAGETRWPLLVAILSVLAAITLRTGRSAR